jgi:hypothetical protein
MSEKGGFKFNRGIRSETDRSDSSIWLSERRQMTRHII